jgi:hypothetical protein
VPDPHKTDDIATTMVVIDFQGAQSHPCFPNPLMVQGGMLLRWHCNPPRGELFKGGPIVVEFDKGAPVEPLKVTGEIGGHTDYMTVLATASPGQYSYHVTVGGTTWDPEIIIEEAPARARAAGASS